MILLTRSRVKSNILKSFHAKKQRERMVDLMKLRRAKLLAGEDPSLSIDSKWSKTKKQLLKETENKCAYCESHTTVIAFGDVEHYRPKSVYWWLAYVYDNYLASCTLCNQRFKSDIFEFEGPQMQGPEVSATMSDAELMALAEEFTPDPLDPVSVEAFEQMHRDEQPTIPNPYIDDPEPIFAWDVLRGAREVEVIPNPDHPKSETIVEACERIFGLNRPELRRERYKTWTLYNLSVRTMLDEGAAEDLRADAKASWEDTLLPSQSYAGMIRYFEKLRLVD